MAQKVKRSKYCTIHGDTLHEFSSVPHDSTCAHGAGLHPLALSVCLDCRTHKPRKIVRKSGSTRVYDGKFYVTMNKQMTAGIEHAFKNRLMNYLLHNHMVDDPEELTDLDNYELAPRVANGSKSVLDTLRKHENRKRKSRKRGTSDTISGKAT